jgi:hypothetical protein
MSRFEDIVLPGLPNGFETVLPGEIRVPARDFASKELILHRTGQPKLAVAAPDADAICMQHADAVLTDVDDPVQIDAGEVFELLVETGQDLSQSGVVPENTIIGRSGGEISSTSGSKDSSTASIRPALQAAIESRTTLTFASDTAYPGDENRVESPARRPS